MAVAGAQDDFFTVLRLPERRTNFFFVRVFSGDEALRAESVCHVLREGHSAPVRIGRAGGAIVGAAAEEGVFIRPEGRSGNLADRLARHAFRSAAVFRLVAKTRLRLSRKHFLIAKDFLYGSADLFHVKFSPLRRFVDGLCGGQLQIKGTGYLRQIHTGLDGRDHAFRRSVIIPDGAHFHAVRENQPPEAQLLLQKPGDHPPGHGAGNLLRLNIREQHVAHHDGRYPGFDGAAEGDQLQLFQRLLRFIHPGKPQMAVHRRIAVAGEMLGAAQHPASGIGCDGGTAQGRHALRFVAEAAHADHRISWIAVDIQHRRHVEVGAQPPQLPDGDLRSQAGIFRVCGSRQRHGAGDVYGVLGEPRHHAALLVDDDKGRVARLFLNQRLNLGAERAKLLRAFHVAQEQDHVADLVFPEQILKFLRQRFPVKSEYQLLPEHSSHFHIFRDSPMSAPAYTALWES